MFRQTFTIVFAAMLFASGTAKAASGAEQAPQKEPTYKIRWMLNHTPYGYFLNAANRFGKEVAEKTNGDVVVEATIDTSLPADSAWRTRDVIVKKIQSGKADMGQVYTNVFADVDSAYKIMQMPFVFADHKHFDSFAGGALGEELLAKLDGVNLKGMAFTYSGGAIALRSKKDIRTLADLRKSTVHPNLSTITAEVYRTLGAQEFVATEANPKHGTLDENIFNDFNDVLDNFGPKAFKQQKHVVIPFFYLASTALVMDKKFFANLPANYQKIVLDAAKNTAMKEREEIRNMEKKVLARFKTHGIPTYTFSKSEQKKMKEILEPMKKRFSETSHPRFVERLENLKTNEEPCCKIGQVNN